MHRQDLVWGDESDGLIVFIGRSLIASIRGEGEDGIVMPVEDVVSLNETG
ncbi:MAG: hypothetical protein P0119_17080 [Nitrospira sp.]|nr:hypothetical protein [Nitrospira sp.]